MRKMYFLTILIIAVMSIGFIYFSNEEEFYARKFLYTFGIKTEKKATLRENIIIPESFDKIFEDYNDLQKASGLDLAEYKGKAAKKLSFRVVNFPDSEETDVFATVILYNLKPIGGDIKSSKLSGFILPLCAMSELESKAQDIIKN